ncbi:MAG: hypothetical protein PUF72_00145 [Clostridiales bacterium]|nr:hypothetical protein [Clostridiales bacterium]
MLSKLDDFLIKKKSEAYVRSVKRDTDMSSSERRKIGIIRQVISTAVMLMMVLGCVAFAAGTGDDIGHAIAQGMGSVFGVLKIVVVPVAAISLCFCVFQIFVGGERGMETAKKTGLYTAIAVAVVFLAPLIVNTVKGWFENTSDGGIFN